MSKLQTDGLIPPVKSVESIAAGVVRVTVVGTATSELRSRLTAVMGATKWTLVEASNDAAVGVDFRS